MKICPNNAKSNQTKSLGFLWPILDFSTGYDESKQFFSSPSASGSDMRQESGLARGQAVSIAAAASFT
jgi:hypothetical protein